MSINTLWVQFLTEEENPRSLRFIILMVREEWVSPCTTLMRFVISSYITLRWKFAPLCTLTLISV